MLALNQVRIFAGSLFSPAELLFRRRIRTELPKVHKFGVEDEVRNRERKEKGRRGERGLYADCKRNAHESKMQEDDKVLLRQEEETKLSTTYKQSPFTVVQKNGNSCLVEAAGVQYRRNVIYLKTYLERDNVPQATSESSDTTETQGVTPGSPSQELGESDKFRPGVRSEEKLL